MKNRENRWIEFLTRKGYEVEFDKFGYWNDVMYAVKGDEKIAIAQIKDNQNSTGIVRHYDIPVSEKNFRNLKEFNEF